MRVHLLSLPNASTTKAYPLCGFTQRTRAFAALLERLHIPCILYGSEENDAPCQELVSVLKTAERKTLIGDTPYQRVQFTADSLLFKTFNARAGWEIGNRKRYGDIICSLGGTAQKHVGDQYPEIPFLEYSIGYQGVWAPFRVYQSQTWRHTSYGIYGQDGGREFDTTIYPWWDLAAFPYVDVPDPYVIYCGRIQARKGVDTACRAAEAAGVKLVLIGHGDPSCVTYGHYLGEVSDEERNYWLGHATACLMPTRYLEPFGNVQAEAMLCGTPVISTDYGAFVETIETGVTGYRCSSLGEFTQAIRLAPGLNRAIVRQRAARMFSTETAAQLYKAYFRRLGAAMTAGWDSPNENPDWNREHPATLGDAVERHIQTC